MGSARHLAAVDDERVPPALQPYVIRVRPNWVARISAAAVLLLLLFFAITQYSETRSLNERLDRAESQRATADADRRLATEALAQARKAQQEAAADRATALTQNGQLIEIALALEDQITRLGLKPEVPRNDVLRLHVRTPVPGITPRSTGTGGGQSTSSPPANSDRPSGAGGAVSSAPPATPRPTPTGTAAAPTRRPAVGPPVPVASTVTLPSLPIVSITACLGPLVCIR